MAKNNRVKITQSKTYSFKIQDLKYIEAESKRTEKSSAQILSEAIQLHKDVSSGVFRLEMQADETECSDVTPASQLSD